MNTSSSSSSSSSSSPKGVALKKATLRYGETTVFENLDLHAPDGSFTVVLGPSGCGKTSALRAIAGLEPLVGGAAMIDGHDVTALPPRERGVAMMFQSYALYPHMRAGENIAFGLKLARKYDRRRGPSQEEIARRVEEAAALLEIGDLLDRKPNEMSGGQKQRVALARAIVKRPRAFLMDEPLSNLDAQLRAQTRVELIRLQRRLGVTTIYVTHDQVEAMTMATDLVVMNNGRIVQQGPPEALYNRPADVFVARFLGAPAMNLVPAAAQDGTGAAVFHGPDLTGVYDHGPGRLVGPVQLGWRPTRGRITDPVVETRPGLRLHGVLGYVELLGDDVLVTVTGRWGEGKVLMPASAHRPPEGSPVAVEVPPADLHVFDQEGKRV